MNKVMILMIGMILFANNNQNNQFLEYTNKIINYNFYIKNLDKIKSPFYKVINKKVIVNEKSNINNKRIKITLLSVFDKKAYIKIENFVGEELISTTKQWIKLYDKIHGCKLIELNYTNAIFKCKNKMLYKTNNKKLPILRNVK